MTNAILIDRLIGERRPSLATHADVAALELIPFSERIRAASTYDAFCIGAALNPNAPAIQFLQNADPAEAPLVLTYAQMMAKINQSANLFHSLGVLPTDVVSFLLPLVPQSFYGLIGAQAAGIANPVNSLLEPHQISEILQAANTKILLAFGPTQGSDIWEKVQKMRASLPLVKTVLQVGGSVSENDKAQGVISFDELLANFPGDKLTSSRKIAPSDTAAYFHTGGTTGTPKLVRHTHENQVYQAWVVNLMLASKPGGSLLFGLPLFHVGGGLTQALSSFSSGTSLVVLSPAGWRHPNAVREVWKLVERFKPTVFGAVPTVLAAAAAMPSEGIDTSSISVISGGGSAIPVAVANAMEQRFKVPVLEVYGMTETSSIHTISYADRPVRIGTVGHAVPYSRVRIAKVDAQGNYSGECAPNEIGVVTMSGPGVFSGYLNDVHNKGAFLEPGWVNSGDLGRIDEQGYIWLTGRAKDLIIRGGHNIDPMPIEELLYQHPDVALAAVIGQPDAYSGELPLAYVQLKPNVNLDNESKVQKSIQLHEHVRKNTPERAAIPVAVLIVDALPLTAVGKVFKPKLRWDATERVFSQALVSVALSCSEKALTLKVQVGAHGTHGTLATVYVEATSGSVHSSTNETVKATIEKQITNLLNPFVIRHQIVWR